MSAVALISGGAGVAQAATIEPAAAAPASATTLAAADVADTEAPARAVEGTFSYTQDAVSSNAEISGVFCKAAATLCASLPTYGCEAVKAAAVTVAGPQRLVHGHRGRAGRRGGSDLLCDGLLLRYQRCRRRRHLQRRGRGRLPGNPRSDGLRLGRHRPGIQAIARDTLDAETSSAPQALVFAGPFSYPLGSQTLETPPPEIDRNFERQSSIFRK